MVGALHTEDPVQLAVVHELWRRGIVHTVLLDRGQQQWVQDFKDSDPLSSSVWLIGRQRGKSYAAIFLCIDTCNTKSNAIVRYTAKTKDSAVGIVMPTWSAIVATMPPELRPKKGRNEYEYIFPNGSKFVLFGVDAQSFAKGRGPRTDLQIFDEVGFYQDLLSVESALLPALQTTNGKALYVSTPPESLAHPYTERIKAAGISGRLQTGTFYDNPRVDHQKVIQGEAERLGMDQDDFVKSTYFRREFLAELVQEESRSGFPNFSKIKDLVIKDIPAPEYFDAYTIFDLGLTNDPHAVLFARHDWATDTIYVTHELELHSALTTTKMLADQIKAMEHELYGSELWTGTIYGAHAYLAEFKNVPEFLKLDFKERSKAQPYMRACDASTGADKEFTMEYGLQTLPFKKQDKSLQVDALNVALAKQKVLIHPRCKKLLSQLETVTWNLKHNSWVRTSAHHGDLVDCLVALNRHVVHSRTSKLPQKPDLWRQHIHDPVADTNSNLKALKKAFGKSVLG